jgi:hypothetical protein
MVFGVDESVRHCWCSVSYDNMLSKLRMETLWKSGNGHACKWATEDGFQKRFDEAALQERYRIEEQEQRGWLNAHWYKYGTVSPQQARQNVNSGRGQMGPPPPF